MREMKLQDLKAKTPAELVSFAEELEVDLDVVEENVRRMAARAKESGARLRPHAKTHKIPELARLQLEQDRLGHRDPGHVAAPELVDPGRAPQQD